MASYVYKKYSLEDLKSLANTPSFSKTSERDRAFETLSGAFETLSGAISTGAINSIDDLGTTSLS
jgi:hypothetical protein